MSQDWSLEGSDYLIQWEEPADYGESTSLLSTKARNSFG